MGYRPCCPLQGTLPNQRRLVTPDERRRITAMIIFNQPQDRREAFCQPLAQSRFFYLQADVAEVSQLHSIEHPANAAIKKAAFQNERRQEINQASHQRSRFLYLNR